MMHEQLKGFDMIVLISKIYLRNLLHTWYLCRLCNPSPSPAFMASLCPTAPPAGFADRLRRATTDPLQLDSWSLPSRVFEVRR